MMYFFLLTLWSISLFTVFCVVLNAERCNNRSVTFHTDDVQYFISVKCNDFLFVIKKIKGQLLSSLSSLQQKSAQYSYVYLFIYFQDFSCMYPGP